MEKNKAYTAFPFKTGLLFDYSGNQFPTRLHSFVLDEENIIFGLSEPKSAFFIFVYEGQLVVNENITGLSYPIPEKGYAVVNENCEIYGIGRGIVIERLNYKAMFMVGGAVELSGRLKYIDGCTDSLLIPPVMKGDACLNALFFPPNVTQTPHTHPSMRVGMVIRGKGECLFENEVGTPTITPLMAGDIFIIHEDGLHSFNTQESEMVVIAYHPDSDFGPEHEEHPMINRTIVEGIPANRIEDIKTK